VTLLCALAAVANDAASVAMAVTIKFFFMSVPFVSLETRGLLQAERLSSSDLPLRSCGSAPIFGRTKFIARIF
jgi:hypothetical protein